MIRIAGAISKRAEAQRHRPKAEREEAIHQVRLAIKQFRALLRLLKPTLGEAICRQYNKRLRKAAKGLASSRDSTVMRKTLNQLRPRLRGKAGIDPEQLRKKLPVDDTTSPSTSRTVPPALERAIAETARAAQAVEKAPWRSRGWVVAEEGIRAGYRRARRRYQRAQSTRNPEDLHSWRTAAKSLLYQLRLLHLGGSKSLKHCLNRTNRLQKVLGREHDLSVLAERIEHGKSIADESDLARTLQFIRGKQEQLRRESLKLGRTLFSQRPREFVRIRHLEWKAWRKAR